MTVAHIPGKDEMMVRTGLIGLVVLALVVSIPALAQPQFQTIAGGEYVIHAGETVEKDLVISFAQVTVEPGASVNGDIYAISSDLKVYGGVTGNIRSLESNVSLGAQSARIDGRVSRWNLLHWVVLLPGMTRLP